VAPAPLDHRWQQQPGQHQRAADVQVYGPPDVPDVEVEKVAGRGQPRVGDQHVRPAGALGQGHGVLDATEVGGYHLRVTELGGETLQHRGAAGAENQPRPLRV